jgi:hypothetical protein
MERAKAFGIFWQQLFWRKQSLLRLQRLRKQTAGLAKQRKVQWSYHQNSNSYQWWKSNFGFRLQMPLEIVIFIAIQQYAIKFLKEGEIDYGYW